MKQLRLVGIDVAPKPTQAQLDAQHLQLLQAWDGTRFNPAKVPIPQPTVRPIFADSQGNRHILLPTTTGDMVAVPWIASLQSDLATASGGAGGFVPIKSFPKTQPVSADAALMAKVVNAVSVKNSAASDSTNPTSGGSSSSPASNSSSGGLAGLINKEIQKYENMTPLDWLAKAMSHGTEAYKYLFGDPAKLGSPSNSDGPMCFPGDGEPGADPSIWDKLTSLKNIEGGLGSLAEMGLGAALASVGNALLDKVLPVTDSSSLGAQLTAQAAQQVLGQLEGVAKSVAVDLGKQALAGLGTGLGDGGKGVGAVLDGSIADFQKKIDDALEKYTSPGIQGFKWSTASFAMARTGDSTTHGGMIVGTAAKTVLGGVAKPICVLDMQFCPTPTHLSGPVTQGNPTVLIEGRWAARALHTANCVGATTTVKPLVSDVLIGADTKTIAVPVQPAKPKVPPKPAAANPATPPTGPSTPPPQTTPPPLNVPASQSPAPAPGPATETPADGTQPATAAPLSDDEAHLAARNALIAKFLKDNDNNLLTAFGAAAAWRNRPGNDSNDPLHIEADHFLFAALVSRTIGEPLTDVGVYGYEGAMGLLQMVGLNMNTGGAHKASPVSWKSLQAGLDGAYSGDPDVADSDDDWF